MDALTLLTADHNRVRGLFTRWKAAHEAGEDSTAGELYKKIAEELKVHTDIEETVFYPAVDVNDELHEMVMEALEEHKVAKSEIHEASMLPAADDRFAAKVTVLIESVEHHAEEEESEMWTAVRKAMSAEQLERMFEPFFTTKESGTGLGLAVAANIVEQHGGLLHAENNPDKGMTFRLELPLARVQKMAGAL